MNMAEESHGYLSTKSILEHGDAECDVTPRYQRNMDDDGHLSDVIVHLPQQYPTMNSPIECNANSGALNDHSDDINHTANVMHSGISVPADIAMDGTLTESVCGSSRTVNEIKNPTDELAIEVIADSIDEDKGDSEVLDCAAKREKDANRIIDASLNVPIELSDTHNKFTEQNARDSEALLSNTQNISSSTGTMSFENEIKSSSDICRNSIIQDLSRSMQYFIGPRVSPKYESLKDALKDG